MTLKKLLFSIAKELSVISPTPELDARVIIRHVLNKDDSFLFANPKSPISNSQYTKIRQIIRKRKKGWPIAYLVGHKEFFGYDFIVNKNVLIPRPESEWLVEQAIQFIKSKVSKVNKETNILDIGTGSGCIIISLAKELEKLTTYDLRLTTKLYASDISPKALAVAKKNAKKLLFEDDARELDNGSRLRLSAEQAGSNNSIKFIHSDLFTNHLLHKKFNLIIANLPYVPEQNGSRIPGRGSIDFEPKDSIYAQNNGTAIIKKFLKEAKKYLASYGIILLELDPRNAEELFKYTAKIYPQSKVELKKDLAGHDRYLIISVQN